MISTTIVAARHSFVAGLKNWLCSRPPLAVILLTACLFPGGRFCHAESPSLERFGGPTPVDQAADRLTLLPGGKATLFAGEPDVVQPIAFTFDDRGRMWVAENRSYPGWKAEGHDRVLILVDRDGDGRSDERIVFTDAASNLSGIEFGFGGVWLCSSPNLVFIPDADGDDRPDGPPVVVLDGWDVEAKHNVFNSLRWGPDGWLYGCNGILSQSLVGLPETPKEDRAPLNCGVWRYHPIERRFEVVAHGTTNPWGLDFDDYGQMFITNCVIEHAWHVVPGAHFERMFGQDFNPHLYALMPSRVDHIHWAGGPWQEARGGKRHDSFGGGHAHSGAAISLTDVWPPEQRNSLLLCNIHGNRVNQDLLERTAKGYVVRHADDFMLANDPWFRGVAVQAGPDGAIYVADWCDTGECHNYEVADRTNGRIYRVAPATLAGAAPFADLAKLADAELADLQSSRNDWGVRHARRLLQERAARGVLSPAAATRLATMLKSTLPETALPETTRLRALWALYTANLLTTDQLATLFDDTSDAIRGWAVRLAVHGRWPNDAWLRILERRSRDEPSYWVRIELASALQWMRETDRLAVAKRLVAVDSPTTDRSLALLTWYGIEPVVGRLAAGGQQDHGELLELLRVCRLPLVRQFIARRMSATTDRDIEIRATESLSAYLADCDDDAAQSDIALGMVEALQGRRGAKPPASWRDAERRLAENPQPQTRQHAQILSLIFGDHDAVGRLLHTAGDTKASAEARRLAIATLAEAKSVELSTALISLVDDPVVRLASLQAMSAFETKETPHQLLSRYAGLDDDARREAIGVLASRVGYARELLDAIERGQIPRRDVSAFHMQQLASLGDQATVERVGRLLGSVRTTPADRAAAISDHLRRFTPEQLATADKSRGRLLFAKTCATCHKLYDAGGSIGPELTGSQRGNLEYVLKNVLDPSAVVARDYQMTVFELTDGRVLSGIIKRETDHAINFQTATELLTVAKSDIESRHASSQSMMPEGLLATLDDDELRDLFAYLASEEQSPLPTGPDSSLAR